MARRRKLHYMLRPLRYVSWPLQALVLAAFWAICRALPVAQASHLGGRLLRRLGPRLSWHQQLLANLAMACPQARPEQLETLARESWSNFGATVAEYPHLGTMVKRGLERHLDQVVDPAVERWFETGRPLVFVTAHFGNWEISAPAAVAIIGSLTVVYAKQANPLIDWMVQRLRRPLRCGFVTNEAGARPLLAELAAGRSVGLLADLRVDGGEPLTLFGATAPTTLVPARLALKFGCPLVPFQVERLADARFRVTAHAPIRSRQPDASAVEQAKDMMQQFNDLLASWIAADPGAWQCLKRRWSKDLVRRRLSGQPVHDAGGAPAGAIGGGS